MAGPAQELQVAHDHLLSVERHSPGCFFGVVVVTLGYNAIKFQLLCGMAFGAFVAKDVS
jgi:hypothetical protein